MNRSSPRKKPSLRLHYHIAGRIGAVRGKVSNSNILRIGPWRGGLAAAVDRREGVEFHIRRNGRPAYKARFSCVGSFWNSPQGWVAGVSMNGHDITIYRDGKKAFYQQ